MEKKYLNDSGLMQFWGKIKSYTNSVSDALQGQIDDKQRQITANDEDISLLQTRSTQMEQSINNIAVTGGASVANTVTYSNTASGLVSINAQGAIDELSAKKFDKESILQESGDAEDKVMSQKAVSDKLSDLSTSLVSYTTGCLFGGEATAETKPPRKVGDRIDNLPYWYYCYGKADLVNFPRYGEEGKHISVYNGKFAILREISENRVSKGYEAIVYQSINSVVQSGWLFGGTITPESEPRKLSDKLVLAFYIPLSAGTYTNFGGLTVAEGELCYFRNVSMNGEVLDSWSKINLDRFASKKDVSDLSTSLVSYTTGCLFGGEATAETKPPRKVGDRIDNLPYWYYCYGKADLVNFPRYGEEGKHISVYNGKFAILREISENRVSKGYEAIVYQSINSVVQSGWLFGGTITPESEPRKLSDKLVLAFYIPLSAGTYTNFGGLTVAEGELCYFRNVSMNGEVLDSWSKINLDRFASKKDLEGLVTKDDLSALDIDSAVSKWLDQHPEATTTVEDGSVSVNKLEKSLSDKLKRMRVDPSPVYGPNSLSIVIGDNANTKGTGSKNNVFGCDNLQASISAASECAYGYHALFRDWDGNHNVAIGNEAMDNLSHGEYNTALGSNALRVQKKADYGGDNLEGETVNYSTAIGGDSQLFNIGSCNTSVGYAALKGKTHGSVGNNNVAIGYCAGKYNENDSNMLIIDAIDRNNHQTQKENALILGIFNGDRSKQSLKVNAKFACNGVVPQDPLVANDDANDLQSCILLVNQIKDALKKCGIMK